MRTTRIAAVNANICARSHNLTLALSTLHPRVGLLNLPVWASALTLPCAGSRNASQILSPRTSAVLFL
jgi:hypothetical protein